MLALHCSAYVGGGELQVNAEPYPPTENVWSGNAGEAPWKIFTTTEPPKTPEPMYFCRRLVDVAVRSSAVAFGIVRLNETVGESAGIAAWVDFGAGGL